MNNIKSIDTQISFFDNNYSEQIFNVADLAIENKKTQKNSSKFIKSLDEENFKIIKNVFKGKSIVFTGKGPILRKDLINYTRQYGGQITSNNINKKTNLLVVGYKPGKKLKKAVSLGIDIMTMKDFCEIIYSEEYIISPKEILLTGEQTSLL